MSSDIQLESPRQYRPDGGSVIEMHAHSSDKSLDSGVSVEKLVEQAAASGLDGICLTEHNALWPEDDTRRLSEIFEINVLPAIELGTNFGHILAYGFSRYRPQLLMMDHLIKSAEEEGVALIVAHPMRSTGTARRPSSEEIQRWFTGIEAVNGDHSDSDDGYYVRLAQELGVVAIGGSDAHSVQAVGRAATIFPTEIKTISDLVFALQQRNASPLDLRIS